MFSPGCGSSATSASRDDQADEKQAGGAAKSANSSTNQDDPPRREATPRLTVGPFSFLPPTGWETRETPEGITCFAPERPAWKEAGFRPNVGVRKRPHPGVSIERHRDNLAQLFAQSAQQVNRQISDFAKRSGEDDGKSVQLKETGKYTLAIRDLDGATVLSSSFSGVFQLPAGLIATKTHGIQVIGVDALYTISLTFPTSVATEMDDVWKAFERDLHIRQ
jgi:hypothetical protein